jgi:hypothetical protein
VSWVDDHLATVGQLLAAVAAALEAETAETVASFEEGAPPEARGLPAVYAAPQLGDWAERRHLGACVQTTWELRLAVPRYDAGAGLRLLLEGYDVACTVARELVPDALQLGALAGPIVDDVAAGGPALVASIPFTIT